MLSRRAALGQALLQEASLRRCSKLGLDRLRRGTAAYVMAANPLYRECLLRTDGPAPKSSKLRLYMECASRGSALTRASITIHEGRASLATNMEFVVGSLESRLSMEANNGRCSRPAFQARAVIDRDPPRRQQPTIISLCLQLRSTFIRFSHFSY